MLLHSNGDHGVIPRIVGILGLGLIGQAVVESLRKRGFQPVHFQKLGWESPHRLRNELMESNGLLQSVCAGQRTTSGPSEAGKHANQPRGVFELIWCAGRAGFAATDRECDCELAAFDTVLQWAEEIANSQGIQVHVSMMSSAGGLYEGQQRVDEQSPCRPSRPYGTLKLAQEYCLRESHKLSLRRVYRPSSVYGWLRSGQRKGLIPTLIHNGLRNQETRFDGSFNTLRDYVWVGDVAELVVRSLFPHHDAVPTNSTRIIASGQPCSIFQIKQLVEATIGRRLQLKFASQASNALDTTFSVNCARDHGSLTDMSVAIRRIAADFSSNGVWLDVRRPNNSPSQRSA